MFTEEKNGKYTVKTDTYTITMSDDCIDFIIAGEVLAGLRPVSAVNTTDGSEPIEDKEQGTAVLSASVEDGVPVYTWTSKSSLWDKKEYIIRCYETHFEYSVRLYGKGKVDTVNYFSGNLGEGRRGSMYEFDTGFTPIVTVTGARQCYFSAMEDQQVFSYLMIPPMFVYSFTTPGVERKMAFGLAAERGEHNFTQFNYKTETDKNRRRFWLWSDQSGHTEVDGVWETPKVLCYSAADDMDALRIYSDWYYTRGIAKRKIPTEKPPRYWHGPIACGWIEQAAYGAYYKDTSGCMRLSCERVYRNFIRELREKDLHPQLMIIDDKWQECYGSAEPSAERWPDMRGFIDENLEKNNIHTMLWFKLWDSEGLDGDMCMLDENENRLVADPTNPKYREKLKNILYKLLSGDEGCCNAYGLKLDFAFWQPVGRASKSYSGKYGVELLLEYISYIYKCAKEIKPEAIINCSPCHPLFGEFCDHARLHDYHPDLRRCYEEFKFRSEVYRIAVPDALIDTDGAGFSSYRDTMRYMRLAPTLGIPDLYCITPMPSLALSDEDWKTVSRVWEDYGKKIDNMYK